MYYKKLEKALQKQPESKCAPAVKARALELLNGLKEYEKTGGEYTIPTFPSELSAIMTRGMGELDEITESALSSLEHLSMPIIQKAYFNALIISC